MPVNVTKLYRSHSLNYVANLFLPNPVGVSHRAVSIDVLWFFENFDARKECVLLCVIVFASEFWPDVYSKKLVDVFVSTNPSVNIVSGKYSNA